jgi:AcrR family transcriptional regulator
MTDKPTRDRIVEAADLLFYHQGFEQTSFTHIAEAVGITRGNFYHHFKSKDEILDAVIGARLAATTGMLVRWEEEGGHPRGRLLCFVGMLVGNRDKIVQYGCPVGTLCTEMAKLRHPSRDGANQLFVLFRTWLRRQFAGKGRRCGRTGHAFAGPQPGRGHAGQCLPGRRVYSQGSRRDARLVERSGSMFVITLRFSRNKSEAPRLMDAHTAWLRQGMADGVFLLAGRLQPNAGGAIIAHNMSLADVRERVARDPFVAEGVVEADILEITPSLTDERLAFLKDGPAA